MEKPLLLVLAGLPGVGKTTLAKALSKKIAATYIRIDTIEQTLLHQGSLLLGTEGYLVAYSVAQDNLLMGNIVVADSVNPIKETREAWQNVAKNASSRIFEIEVICSDKMEHSQRVKSRIADIEGHKLPTWEGILGREYQPWDTKNMTVDTSVYNTEESINLILSHISQQNEKD